MKRIVKTYDSSIQLFSDIIEIASDIKVLVSYYRWNLVVLVAFGFTPILYEIVQWNPHMANNMGMFVSFFKDLP